MIRAALLAIGLLAGAPAEAQRVEAPIRPVILSDGAKRYGVTLRIGGQTVEAGLDSGSTGLRVLARALPVAERTRSGGGTRYHYGSGTELAGVTLNEPVAVGALPETAVRVQRVDRVDCFEKKATCGAAKLPIERFGIQGDGLPGEGFAAIVGVGFQSDTVPNPLPALGVHRWIVELPRPGDTAPGRLILNPTETETAGYTTVKVLPGMNAVAGCLTVAAPVGQICGPARLDTGAPGIRVVTPRPPAAPPPDSPARLTIGDRNGQASIDVALDRKDQGTGFRFERADNAREPQLFFGLAPYFRWSVLYDADARTIGVRPREER